MLWERERVGLVSGLDHTYLRSGASRYYNVGIAYPYYSQHTSPISFSLRRDAKDIITLVFLENAQPEALVSNLCIPIQRHVALSSILADRPMKHHRPNTPQRQKRCGLAGGHFALTILIPSHCSRQVILPAASPVFSPSHLPASQRITYSDSSMAVAVTRRLLLRPALPSNTTGPASFLGVSGPSAAMISAEVGVTARKVPAGSCGTT